MKHLDIGTTNCWIKKSENVPRSLFAVRVAAVVVITNTAKVVIVGGGGGPHLGKKDFLIKSPQNQMSSIRYNFAQNGVIFIAVLLQNALLT